MERLTERNNKGYAYYPKCFEEPCEGMGCLKETCDFSEQACEKLTAYEETGLTPEQVKAMMADCAAKEDKT